MRETRVRIFSLGDSALTVEFGAAISTELNKKAINLADYFENNPFPGLIESVPAYCSTTFFFDVVSVRRCFTDFPTAFEAVKTLVSAAISELREPRNEDTRTVEIPVRFDAESALDLYHVAQKSGLSPEKVIEIFTASTYRVFMLGFLPGFSYMGEVDDKIATPRKETPRTSVPKGSVGIAGKQTGIYSLASPGGWQIIGRTEVEMFRPDAETPSYLRAGDLVSFVDAR